MNLLSNDQPTLKERLRYIVPYYQHNRLAFILGFFLLAATNVTSATIPYLMKLATENLSAPPDPEGLMEYALALIGMAFLNAFFRIWARTHIFAIGRQVEYELRKRYHAKLLSLDAPFFDQEKTGDLVAMGNNDILAIRMFIGPGFLQLANTFMVYIVTLPIMIKLDPTLTLLALAPFPIILGLTRLLTKRLYRLSKRVADRFGVFSAFVQETVAGIAVIRGHSRETDWNRRFTHEAQQIYQAHQSHARIQSLFSPLVLLAGGLGGIIILFNGGQAVMEGRLTIGDFVAFSGYLALLVWPTVGFGWILTVLQRGLAALERIGRVLDSQHFPLISMEQPNHSSDKKIDLSKPTLSGAVLIRDLNFSYDGKKPTLRHIHMDIAAGSFIGLVGRIGSGKSALLNCLARLYPVDVGSIFLDGKDIMSIEERELRRILAMAPQESFMFSDTVRNNLLLGCPEANDTIAWQAARLASFETEIQSFPDTLNTLVGERGITLSGGQRQRAALARALTMNPNILLLDDIFSSVDARTEATILQNVHSLVGSLTLIMVCHRTAALHRANQVYLLDEGSIVGHGTHADLLANNPLYQDLHQQMVRAEALESLQ